MKTTKKRSAKSTSKSKKSKSVKSKAKRKPAVRAKAKTARGGKKITIAQLVALKKVKQQQMQNGDDWQHKKDLPPHELGAHDNVTDLPAGAAKKTGFGGTRHH